jgi:formylglycine-generating enzyme required for sulfatase activity
MTCVTWFEAYAFCIWDGGYLPSEAEWEFAAAGGGLERQYPWGSQDPGTAGAYATFGCDGGASCATPVGFTSMGFAEYGHYDMMGNAAEWVLDDYIDYDDPSTGGEPCVDCMNYDIGGEGFGTESKVARGGGYPYKLGDQALYPPGRSSFPPDSRHAYLGVRCGRNPPP